MMISKRLLTEPLINKDYRTYTLNELGHIYDTLEGIVDNLDVHAINELLQGNEKDIDKLFYLMYEEVENVLMLNQKTLNSNSLHYLDTITNSLDEYLKCSNLNYFISTTLPSFNTEWFHLEWGNMAQMYRKLLILAARGHGKSFYWSWAYPLWMMYRYEKPSLTKPVISNEIQLCKEGMLITNEFKLARKLLKKVRDEIVDNDILARKLKPDSLSEGLGSDQLRTKNGAVLDISSFHSSNRGPHPGWIVLDDFLDKSALYSSDQRAKFWDSLTAEITNMLMPSGSFKMVGTPFHEKDVYGLLKQDVSWKCFEYPGIFPDGTILSNRFPSDELMNIRQSLGSMIFTREYLCRPVSNMATIFPYSILELSFIGMSELKLVENRQSYPVKMKKIVIGCDFAISSTIAADYSVFSVIGVDNLDNFHLMNLVRLHGSSHNEQIGAIQTLNSNFQPDTIIMEDNGFQRVMLELAKERGIKNVQPFTTTGFSKKDPYEGLPSLSISFERGQIRFPRGDERSRQVTDLICQEFNSITFDDTKNKLQASSGHDDTVMSVFFSIRGSNQINSQMNISFI